MRLAECPARRKAAGPPRRGEWPHGAMPRGAETAGELSEELKQERERRVALENELRQAEEWAQEWENERNSEREQLQKQIDELRERAETAEAKAIEAEEELRQAEELLDEDPRDGAEDRRLLSEKVKEAEKNLEKAEKKATTAEKAAEAAEKKAASAEESTRKVEKRNTLSLAQIEELQEELSMASKWAADEEQSNKAKIEQIRGETEKAKSETKHIRAQLKEKTKELEQKIKELESKTKALESAKAQGEQTSGELDKAKSESKHMRAQLDERSRELEEKTKELTIARNDYGNAKTSGEKYLEELEQMKAEMSSVVAKLEEKTKELEEKSKELESKEQARSDENSWAKKAESASANATREAAKKAEDRAKECERKLELASKELVACKAKLKSEQKSSEAAKGEAEAARADRQKADAALEVALKEGKELSERLSANQKQLYELQQERKQQQLQAGNCHSEGPRDSSPEKTPEARAVKKSKAKASRQDETRPRILVAGLPGHGKSTLLNEIVGEDIFRTAAGSRTGTEPGADSSHPDTNFGVDLVDTPSFPLQDPKKAKEAYEEVVRSCASPLSAVVFVLNAERKSMDACKEHLKQWSGLAQLSVPLILVANGFEPAKKEHESVEAFDERRREGMKSQALTARELVDEAKLSVSEIVVSYCVDDLQDIGRELVQKYRQKPLRKSSLPSLQNDASVPKLNLAEAQAKKEKQTNGCTTPRDAADSRLSPRRGELKEKSKGAANSQLTPRRADLKEGKAADVPMSPRRGEAAVASVSAESNAAREGPASGKRKGKYPKGKEATAAAPPVKARGKLSKFGEAAAQMDKSKMLFIGVIAVQACLVILSIVQR